jgi:hypothetical protein
MKEFLNTYADVLQSNHEQVGQVHIDFKRQCLDMTIEKLLEQFVQSKYTGFEKPGTILCIYIFKFSDGTKINTSYILKKLSNMKMFYQA